MKVNVDTETQHAFTAGVAEHVAEHPVSIDQLDGGPQSNRAFDPRGWGRRAQRSMAEHVAATCLSLGSAGRALSAASRTAAS